MRTAFVAALAAALLVGFHSAGAGGNAEAGKSKSAACAACHGVDGNSVNPQWPKLAGQHATYLVMTLRAYRDGARKNPMMQPMAKNLSDEDIDDLAAYFAGQKQK